MTPAGPKRNHSVTRTLRASVLTMLLLGALLPQPPKINVIAVAAVLSASLLALELIRSTLTTATKITINPAIRLTFLTFGALAIPGLLNTPTTQYGHDKFVRLVTLTLLSAAATAAIVRDRHDLRAFAIVWLLAGCVLAVATLTGDVQNGRSVGWDANPIWLARALCSAIVAVMWMYWRGSLRPWLAAPLLLLLSLGLFATGSRGPFLATVVGGLVLFASGRGKMIARFVLPAAAGTAALVVALLASPTTSNTRISQFLVNPRAGISSDARSDLLGLTIPVIAQHPNGIGYGNWGVYAGVTFVNYPHNLWLEVLAEAGWLVGGVLILAVALTVIRLWTASKFDPDARLALGLLISEMVSVSLSGDLNARSFFAFLALSQIVLRWKRDEPAEDPHSSGRDAVNELRRPSASGSGRSSRENQHVGRLPN